MTFFLNYTGKFLSNYNWDTAGMLKWSEMKEISCIHMSKFNKIRTEFDTLCVPIVPSRDPVLRDLCSSEDT